MRGFPVYLIHLRSQGRSPHGKHDTRPVRQNQNLYHIHARLDGSVLEAYGWPHNLSNEGILEKLLALNMERAGK